MAYLHIQDFRRGLDARRLPEATEPGALLEGENVVVTRGGDIEKAKSWVAYADLPAGTVGMHITDSDDPDFDTVHVFAHELVGGPLPANTVLHVLTHPDKPDLAISKILDVEDFYGELYVVAEFADGSVQHFYRGDAIVPTVGDDAGNLPSIGVGQAVAEITFEFWPGDTAADVDGTEQITAVQLLEKPGTDQQVITELMDADVTLGADADFVQLATDVAAAINATTSLPNFVANADGATVRVATETATSDYNGAAIRILKNGRNPLLSPTSYVYLSGGIDLPPPTPEEPDPSVGDNWNPGKVAHAFSNKMYAIDGSFLNFSAVGSPTIWTTDGTGAGFIDMSTQSRGAKDLTAISEYQGLMAIFSRRSVMLWYMDPGGDPQLNNKVQVLHNTGTLAPRSVVPFGRGDVFYLDQSGIRSLRARDSSNAAFASDVGNMVDELVRSQLSQMAGTEDDIIGVVEPMDGRFMLKIGDIIYVLSWFPESKISAWTTFRPGRDFDYLCPSSRRLYARSANRIYIYGGVDGETYDSTAAKVRLPYMDGDKPATKKQLTGLDMACQGTWKVQIGLDPVRTNVLDDVAIINRTTYAEMEQGLMGMTSHFSLAFETSDPVRARIASIAVHYNESGPAR